MKIISHRGNLNGPILEKENTPNYIDDAICKQFDVEIDIWCIDEFIFLGHDAPMTKIEDSWLIARSNNLWCHAKNLEAICYLNNIQGIHYFWHETDKITLTNRGIPWCYPGNYLKNGITVELNYNNIPKVYGICTDYPLKWK
jgi:hypothetical protein